MAGYSGRKLSHRIHYNMWYVSCDLSYSYVPERSKANTGTSRTPPRSCNLPSFLPGFPLPLLSPRFLSSPPHRRERGELVACRPTPPARGGWHQYPPTLSLFVSLCVCLQTVPHHCVSQDTPPTLPTKRRLEVRGKWDETSLEH